MNVPHDVLVYLDIQDLPAFVEYSMQFLAGLILIISLPNVIIFGIIKHIIKIDVYALMLQCLNNHILLWSHKRSEDQVPAYRISLLSQQPSS